MSIANGYKNDVSCKRSQIKQRAQHEQYFQRMKVKGASNLKLNYQKSDRKFSGQLTIKYYQWMRILNKLRKIKENHKPAIRARILIAILNSGKVIQTDIGGRRLWHTYRTPYQEKKVWEVIRKEIRARTFVTRIISKCYTYAELSKISDESLIELLNFGKTQGDLACATCSKHWPGSLPGVDQYSSTSRVQNAKDCKFRKVTLLEHKTLAETYEDVPLPSRKDELKVTDREKVKISRNLVSNEIRQTSSRENRPNGELNFTLVPHCIPQSLREWKVDEPLILQPHEVVILPVQIIIVQSPTNLDWKESLESPITGETAESKKPERLIIAVCPLCRSIIEKEVIPSHNNIYLINHTLIASKTTNHYCQLHTDWIIHRNKGPIT